MRIATLPTYAFGEGALQVKCRPEGGGEDRNVTVAMVGGTPDELQHRPDRIGEDRNWLQCDILEMRQTASTGPRGSVRIATNGRSRRSSRRTGCQHRPERASKGSQRERQRRPGHVGQGQHRPEMVGEDRNNEARTHRYLLERRQHRPEMVGEDRNLVGTQEVIEGTDSSTVPLGSVRIATPGSCGSPEVTAPAPAREGR